MSAEHSHSNYPKLHNAMWPGLVGKGSPGAEPGIDLDTMLDVTARAEVEGIKFDGVDLFLFAPHVGIDSDEDALKGLADKVRARNLVIGSVVAPVWPATGGGSAMGSDEERRRFVEQVRKACRMAKSLRELGVRPYGVVRIDSACGVADWAQDAQASQQKIGETFNGACDVAEDFGERLAAEGEICWGGLHSWKRMVEILERVNRPQTLGFQADMAHTLLYLLGYNAPEDAILPPDWDWSDPLRLDHALQTLTKALRPWTIDFHVAQNDATVAGSGTHDKTGHHCLPKDPNGKLRIAHHAGYWLHGEDGRLTKALRHICWDGCMFPNAVMQSQETWNGILRAMIAVRDAHGWREDQAPPPAAAAATAAVELETHVEPAQTAPPPPPPSPRLRATEGLRRGKPKIKPKKSAKPASRKAVKKPDRKSARKVKAKRATAKAAPKARPAKAKAGRKAAARTKKSPGIKKAKRRK